MKRVLCLLVMAVAVMLMFTACGLIHGAPDVKEDVITIEDGYLVVNGVKTEHRVYSDPVVSVVDGYLAVNGIKTEYKVDADDVIEIVDGYVVVNGVKTEHKVDTPDVIEIINGYVYVNGIKTDIFVPSCNHSWTTVTTAPTCKEGGYDTKTCALCGKSVVENETAKLDHNYATTYSFDDNNHWFGCTGCDAKKDVVAHTPDADGICTVCQMPTSATPGVIYDISVDGTYAEVIGYEGTATKVKIASEYKGLPVKNIYDNAFSSQNISEIILSENITNISYNAFGYITYLKIYVPTLSTWLNISFEPKYNMEIQLYIENMLADKVVIPGGFTTIRDFAFAGCTSITEVVIPNGVTSIGASAFYKCSSLVSIDFGSSVERICSSAFYYCSALESVEIPDSVKSMGTYAFGDCTNLKSAVIGDGITEIYNYFNKCSNLKYLSISDNVTFVSDTAFADCPGIKFNEYDNALYLGNESNPYVALITTANKNCSRYTVHEGTKVIADYAFRGCSRLSSLVVPKSVTHIGHMALSGGNNLTDVYYAGTQSEWESISIHDMGNELIKSATKHYNYVPEE